MIKLYWLFFVFLITIFTHMPCLAGFEDYPESVRSLCRIYDVCKYTQEDANLKSTQNIVVLDHGFDISHRNLIFTFYQPYHPSTNSSDVNQIQDGQETRNIYGTAVSGIIHDLTPNARIIPIVYTMETENEALKSLDYALNKADGKIINISLSLSLKGYLISPIDKKIKELIIKALPQEKIIIFSAGNIYSPMDAIPRTIDLTEIARMSNHKMIIVGGTICNNNSDEELWVDHATVKTVRDDRTYIAEYIMGSTYPGKNADYQNVFVTAPAKHHTSLAYCGPNLGISKLMESNARRYFGMTSSAAPVVTAIAERLWTISPNSSATDVGQAIYDGTNRNFSSFSPEYYGKGMVNYRNSKALLKSKGSFCEESELSEKADRRG